MSDASQDRINVWCSDGDVVSVSRYILDLASRDGSIHVGYLGTFSAGSPAQVWKYPGPKAEFCSRYPANPPVVQAPIDPPETPVIRDTVISPTPAPPETPVIVARRKRPVPAVAKSQAPVLEWQVEQVLLTLRDLCRRDPDRATWLRELAGTIDAIYQ